ncbi:MAG: sporulation protein YtfJ [Clostridia bacterium]|nr:sporulation protein YtfJ [Clostridia bacterium]
METNDIPLKQVIEATISKIKTVADVNTVVGEPITLPDGITVIPFSKVSVGFASGGVDFDGKNDSVTNEKKPAGSPGNHFAGGNGAGVSVVPMGFIIINGSDVKVVDVKTPFHGETAPLSTAAKTVDTVNTLLDKAPEIIEKLKTLLKKDKKEKNEDTAEAAADTAADTPAE